jgi:hypothetical protein
MSQARGVTHSYLSHAFQGLGLDGPGPNRTTFRRAW